MAKLKIDSVPLASIVLADERRGRVRRSTVVSLKESMTRRGLLSAIRVRRDGRVVCGANRFVAAEELGWEQIDVIYVDGDEVEIELDEIEENLCRNDMTVLDRSVARARRKTLYEQQCPETAKGVAGGKARHGLQPKAPSFAGLEATRAGKSTRLIEQEVQIGTVLKPAQVDALREHPVAGIRDQLLALARVPEHARDAVVAAVTTAKVKDIKAAIKALHPPTPRKPSRPFEPTFLSECPIERAADGLVGHADVRGRRLRLELPEDLRTIRIVDLGAIEPEVPVAPVLDVRPLNLATSLTMPDEVVSEFPADIAKSISLSPIYIEDECRCPACGGSDFVRSDDVEHRYACRACLSYSELLGHGFFGSSRVEIRSPRLVRHIRLAAPEGVEQAAPQTIKIIWSHARERMSGMTFGAEAVSVEIPRVGSIVMDDPKRGASAEAFRALLRKAILGAIGYSHRVETTGDRHYRDEGSEIALVAGKRVVDLPTVETRSALVTPLPDAEVAERLRAWEWALPRQEQTIDQLTIAEDHEPDDAENGASVGSEDDETRSAAATVTPAERNRDA